MTALGKSVLPQIALNVLAQHAGSNAGPEAVAMATRRAYDDLARVLVPLIGQAGVDALTGRALHLAQKEYPWLGHAGEPPKADGALLELTTAIAKLTGRAVAPS